MFDEIVNICLAALQEEDKVPLDRFFANPDSCTTSFSIEDVKKLQEDILKLYDIKSKIIYSQDAFFSVELQAVKSVKYPWAEEKVYYLSIRFSDFGKFFTILNYSNFFPVIKIINFLEKKHFSYIPREVLDTKYQGSNKKFLKEYDSDAKNEITWYNRFFDYI